MGEIDARDRTIAQLVVALQLLLDNRTEPMGAFERKIALAVLSKATGRPVAQLGQLDWSAEPPDLEVLRGFLSEADADFFAEIALTARQRK